MTTRHDETATPDKDRHAPDSGRPAPRRYAPSTRAHDLALLAAGIETGWWDEDGHPAPWPEDFFLADGTINPDWTMGDDLPATPPKAGEPPF